MKTIVYSANIGNYDTFRDPDTVDPNVEYILFTDYDYESKVWNVINISSLNLPKVSERKLARCLKINSHLYLPEHDISMWIDYSFKPRFNDLNNCISNFINSEDKDIMCYSHDTRRCIYDEANICISHRLDNNIIIKNQMIKYAKNNFPKKYGLFATGIMIRKNNENVKNFNNIWWEEVYNGSVRDQLSQCYASWKSNVKIYSIELGKSVYRNKFVCDRSSHKKKRNV